MRKLLIWLGAVALAVLLVAVIGFGTLLWGTLGLNREGKIYAGEATLAVVQHWESAALEARATPALRATLKPDQLASLFRWFQTLGALQKLDPCDGDIRVNVSATAGRVTTGQFNCPAQFEAGAATISLLILKT